jgi:hypothetical protein
MIYRLRTDFVDSAEHIVTGAGGEHIAPGTSDALYNLAHLFHRLTLAEHHFRKSLPQPTVVVDLRKSEILVGQVAEDLQSFLCCHPLVVDVF